MQWPLGQENHFSLDDQLWVPCPSSSLRRALPIIAVQFAAATALVLVPNQRPQGCFHLYR